MQVYRGNLILENKIADESFLLVEDGKILDIKEKYQGDYMDFGGNFISPGLVDLHIHGFKGFDTSSKKLEDIEGLSRALLDEGVTSFMPSLLTLDRETYKVCIKNLSQAEYTGARSLGIFLEGPFISPNYSGSQNPGNILPLDLDFFFSLDDLAFGTIKKVNICPGLEGSREFIKALKEKGKYVSLGHSGASYEEASRAFLSGASCINHCFNAMGPFHHRDPGLIGLALLKKPYAELIYDGYHVSKAAAELLIKNNENCFLISDSLNQAGLKYGKYDHAGLEVFYSEDGIRLADGRLAGASSGILDSVRKIYSDGLVDLVKAFRMASLIPAKSIGQEEEIGSLAKGKRADFLVLTKGLELVKTYVEGRVNGYK